MKQIAVKAGVSLGTVSHVLNDSASGKSQNAAAVRINSTIGKMKLVRPPVVQRHIRVQAQRQGLASRHGLR